MITLAILYWLCSHIPELEVGKNVFYEDLPIDINTGALTRYGVYATTESASVQQNGDRHQFINFAVAIGEGATDKNGCLVAEKYETDKLINKIQNMIDHALEYSDELCNLQVPCTEFIHRDVRLLPSASKMRGVTLTNGAIVKSLTAEVYYK